MSFEKRDQILSRLATKSKRALYKVPRLKRNQRWCLPYRPRRELLERLSKQLGYSQTEIEKELRLIRKAALQGMGLDEYMVQHFSGLQ